MTIGEFRHTNTFTRQRSKVSNISNLDVAVSSFWQLARHWNQGDKAKLELSCENRSLHMQLSAVLGHPDQPHFPHPPPPHSPPHPPPPSFPPVPKKKSPSQLRRQERRQYEASINSQRAASKESASSNLGDGKPAASSPGETKRIYLSILMKELKMLIILTKKIRLNLLKLLPEKLLERQHCQVFSLSVTSVIMKVLLTKVLNNTLE